MLTLHFLDVKLELRAIGWIAQGDPCSFMNLLLRRTRVFLNMFCYRLDPGILEHKMGDLGFDTWPDTAYSASAGLRETEALGFAVSGLRVARFEI